VGDITIVGPITVNLTFLGVATAVVAAVGVWLRYRHTRHKREYEIDQEYSGLKQAREMLWTAVHEAYPRFQSGHTSAPQRLDDLLAIVGMPPDVGERGGRDLLLWPTEHAQTLNHDQRKLWEFVSLVYPPRDGRAGKITDHSIVSTSIAEAFHEARGKLAHFWNRAARDVPVTFLARQYQSALPDLILLSWFDIALKQWTRDPDEGKVFLFKLGHAACLARKAV